VIPRRFRIAHDEVIVPVGVIAIVDPAWRRRGVFTALVHRSNDAWRHVAAFQLIERPVGSWRINASTGWKSVGTSVFVRRRLAPVSRAAAHAGIPFIAPWAAMDRTYARVASVILDREIAPHRPLMLRDATSDDSDLLGAHISGWPLAAVRDAAWFAAIAAAAGSRHRLVAAAHGQHPVAVVGLRVVDHRPRDGFITDAVIAPNDRSDLATILRGSAAALHAGGATVAFAQAVPGSTWHGALREAGFSETRRRHEIGVIAYQAPPGVPIEAWWWTGAEGSPSLAGAHRLR
jgi:hypothetical protein